MSTLAQVLADAPSTKVLVNGYELDADTQGYYGNIRFWFSGADLFNFTNAVSGLPQTLTIEGASVTRLIPLIHPYIIGGNCYADRVKVYPPEGAVATLDDTGSGISFIDYFADVHFGTYPYPMETGDYPTVTLDLQGGAEMVTRPGWAYKYLTDGKPIDHDLGVPVTVVDFTMTMHRLPQLDVSLYVSLAGSVDSEPFFGLAAGTVLYNGPGVQGQQTIAGSVSFDCAHDFQYRSIPHNQVMRDDGTGFDTPVQIGDGATMMLPEMDLNQLWGM